MAVHLKSNNWYLHTYLGKEIKVKTGTQEKRVSIYFHKLIKF